MIDTISLKICLLGDYGVGKTSLVRQFVERQFSDDYLSTIGVKISRKPLEFSEAQVRLIIWDLEGQTKFLPIASTYLQGAMGAFVVCDPTQTETIQRLSEHIDNFFEINPEGLLMVAFNKYDLFDSTEFHQIIQKFQPKKHDRILGVYPTSAKTGENVDLIFETLAGHLVKII